MKLLTRILFSTLLYVGTSIQLNAQCTQAQLNWDNLDYYYNSNGATTAPYATYVTTAMAATQKFAIGTTYLTIATPATVTNFIKGENATHTSTVVVSGTAGASEKAQFTPTVASQKITITFATEVQNVKFVLYDIDASAVFNIEAKDALLNPKNITATRQATTALATTTLIGLVETSGTTNVTVRATNTTNYSTNTTTNPTDYNRGTATISISGGVKEVTITATTLGSNPDFWLSDIDACVAGTFPVNYHQRAATRPFTGQPDYFFTTPDNNYVYMADAASGKAVMMFRDPENLFVNSLAYDAVNHLLYYVTDGSQVTGSPITTSPSVNKRLKKYDFETGTISIVSGDLSALLGLPTFEQGFESGAACFYNDALYLGVEGGRFSTGGSSPVYTSRESIIYKIEFNASLAPVNAYQVWSTPAYNLTTTASNPTYSSATTTAGTMSMHDWGDFLIKDGILYDFNTARTNLGTNASPQYIYPNSSVYRFNMMTGVTTNAWNPNQGTTAATSAPYVGQVSLDWTGNFYSVRSNIQKFNLTDNKLYHPTTNVLNGGQTITAASGSPAWAGNAGDGSEPFRPKADFGDAPVSYDPNPLAPAVHDYSDNNVRLGPTIDREWNETSSTDATADGGDEDGLSFTYIYNNGTNYLAEVQVYNNPTISDPITDVATVAAWLDFNQDGTFQASEGVSTTVAKSASVQTITLMWPSNAHIMPGNTNTYLRVRIASNSATTANNLSTAKSTGYMANGEVEDYYVLANVTPLAIPQLSFTAVKNANKVQVKWSITGTNSIKKYIVAKSADKLTWKTVSETAAAGKPAYLVYDADPLHGISYYRLQVVEHSGSSSYSDIKKVDFNPSVFEMTVSPNPSASQTSISIYAPTDGSAVLRLLNLQGMLISKELVLLQKGYTTRNLPTDKLPSGVYFLEVQQGVFLNRKKILVVR